VSLWAEPFPRGEQRQGKRQGSQYRAWGMVRRGTGVLQDQGVAVTTGIAPQGPVPVCTLGFSQRSVETPRL
jgi:hypothetical protein